MKKIGIEYTPTKKQQLFHQSSADEVLFGGAAGGGKSHAIVMDALDRCLRTPGVSAYLFRRTYMELRDTLIAAAKRLVPGELGFYRAADHEMVFFNGSKMKFRHLFRDEDKYKYQGSEINFLYIDELTHFKKSDFDYLKSRLRAKKELHIRPLVRCTSNPGGIGHGWVKQYFVDCVAPGEVLEREIYSRLLDKTKKSTRLYIPARVTDNPHIGESYIYELEQKPRALREALLFGKWDAFEGQVFLEWRDEPEHYGDRRHTHVVEPFALPAHYPRFRSFDFGYSRPFSVLWWAVGEENELYLYKEWYGASSPNVGLKLSPREIAQGILLRDGDDSITESFADPSIWDSSRGESVAAQMEAAGVYFVPGENARLSGKMAVHDKLKFDAKGKPGMQVFSSCREFIRTLPALCYSGINPEDIDTQSEDHSYDAMRYFLMNKVRGKVDITKTKRKFNPLEEEQRWTDDFREL